MSSLVELGMINVVGAVILGGVLVAQVNDVDRSVGRLTGEQLKGIGAAAETYVKARWGVVAQNLPATLPIETLEAYSAGGRLPRTSPNGHQFAVRVLPGPAPATMYITVAMSGRGPVSSAVLSAAKATLADRAMQVEAAGGRLTAWGFAAPRATPIELPAGAADDGTPMATIYLTERLALPEWLSRHPIPGLPEAQRMADDLDLGGHALRGVSELRARRATVSGAVESNSVRAGTVEADEGNFGIIREAR